jgi:uncharacterized delta-60 repeat protein
MNSRRYHLTTRRSAVRTLAARMLLWGLLLLACALGAALAPTPAHAQSADLPFAPDVNGGVNAVAVQADGKILIGGGFTQVDGQSHNYIARLLPNGELDQEFSASVTGGVIISLAIDDDGKILVVGLFSMVNGVTKANIARLNQDGSLDDTFVTTANATVWCVALQQNGQILLGGDFHCG